MNLLGVVLVDLGLVLGVVCLGSLLTRWRRWAPRCLALGLLSFLAGMVLPAPAARTAGTSTRLDQALPAWQFREVHVRMVAADCAQAYQAARQVTAPEIALFRTLTWLRRLGRRGPESILDAPERIPLLEIATRTGFLALADDPGREVVIGTVVMAPPLAGLPPGTPEAFADLRGPGYAKAAMNFLMTPAGAGCLVSTETRVYATDPAARRRFAAYWRVIYPGSALIRRMWLRAIARRAAPA